MTASRRWADATHVLATHIDDYLTDYADQLDSTITVELDRTGDTTWEVSPSFIAAALRSTARTLHALEAAVTAQVKADDLTLDLQ